jgi:hypothetical protein
MGDPSKKRSNSKKTSKVMVKKKWFHQKKEL